MTSSSDKMTGESTQFEERGRRRESRLSHLSDEIHELDEIEAELQAQETRDRGIGALHHIRSRTRSLTNEVLVTWDVDDPENPYNWPNSKKFFIVLTTTVLVINSGMGSSLPSMAVPFITKEFGITSSEQKVLPISMFLLGYVFGPIIWGPLSEHFGRRILTIATFLVFMIFTMACALAPTWSALLVFRFFAGLCAGAPNAIVAGILADIYGDPRTRGRAFAVFMANTLWAPLFSPIISGYTSVTIGWRWSFWIGLIYAGATLIFILLLPETFAPILLARRAAKIRKADPSSRVVAPRDLEETDVAQLLTVVVTRPFRMLLREPIVSATCSYLALAYTIFYMSFQAFPIIFQHLYGLSPGVTGLCYLPIGIGAVLSLPTFWYWDIILGRAQDRNAPWTKREEYRRLPLACIGGPLFVISLFWLGFSSKLSISFVVPMLAGIPFGVGYQLIFMALLNYLTDAYEKYAASANAAASCTRSILAVVLPLATSHMFDKLGISGACALLGGACCLMCIIPFVFIWQGNNLRNRSPFCIMLREEREEAQRRLEERRQRLERAAQWEKEGKEEESA